MAKYVIITGGVVSGLGKGITAASLGRLLKSRGYKVTLQKFDPYFNVDSSNLSPFQHGEVFVTSDGAETDPVIGHYERFIDEDLSGESDITSGKVYSTVIENERNGMYNGGTVQVVPHITDEIQRRLLSFDDDTIVIVDVGGTVGDIECHPFLEAFKQLRIQVGRDNVAYVHVSFVPFIEMSGEQKTKPTQHSVKELQNIGIQPDVIVCRSDYELAPGSKKKLAAFCNVPVDCIIESLTNDHILELPLRLEEEGFASVVLRKLKLEDEKANLDDWKEVINKAYNVPKKKTANIAVVGKYVEKHDAYVSLIEAIKYSAISLYVKFNIDWIECDKITEANVAEKLSGYDGIILPAGFGERGFSGKIYSAKFARENNVPCLMIGLGAQAGYIEFARNVVGIKDANSNEFSANCKSAVVCKSNCGFKKGSNLTLVENGTKLNDIYKTPEIWMRHRHRYELSGKYAVRLQHAGLVISGKTEDGHVDSFELADKKFYVGVAFQPEFAAKVGKPDPLISAFLLASSKEI